MFDKENAKNSKFRNKERINKLTVGILNYYSDPQKKVRLANGLCKHCYYVYTDRIGGAAITYRNCANCNVEMSFGSTCTDMLCRECAVKIGYCRFCSQKIEK